MVFTGAIGAGKTRVLETIIAAKERLFPWAGPPALEWVTGDARDTAKITMTWLLTPAEQSLAGATSPSVVTESIYGKRSASSAFAPDPGIAALFERYDHEGAHFKMDYVPDDRHLPTTHTLVSNPIFDQRSRRLVRGPDKYGSLARIVADAMLRGVGPERRTELDSLLGAMIPHLRVGGPRVDGALEFHRRSGRATTFGRLSMGERTAFILAASMVYIGLQSSVILLDTPELGITGADARRVLEVLMEFAPGSQWIVATRAVEVWDLADSDARFTLEGQS